MRAAKAPSVSRKRRRGWRGSRDQSPSVAKAFAQEMTLYQEEQARAAAAA